MDEQKRMEQRVKISQVFRPGAPIDKYALFAGRLEQVKDVIDATIQPGRHVILYGERGVGKTSLAKVISEILSNAGVKLLDSGTINCDPTDDFSSLWHKIFRELSIVLENKETRQVGFVPPNGRSQSEKVCLEELLPEKTTPDDVRYVFNYVPTKSIIIIDEIDRLKNQEATTLLADTIKNLSDHSVKTTLILVGVADSVGDLIAEHKSIERAIIQVPMPRMSRSELIQILDKGLPTVNMTIEEPAKNWIADLSKGLPHYTHSLGLYAALKAIDDDRDQITRKDVVQATQTIVQKSHTILSAYNLATSSPQKQNIFSHVLLACALANKDELGYFSARTICAPLSVIIGKTYDIPNFARHLLHFCDVRRGPILQKIGESRKFRYRFVDPLMQPFVIIHGYATGLLNQELLHKLRDQVK